MRTPATVYINGRFLTQPLSGMQRYAQEIVQALDAILAQRRAEGRAGFRAEIVIPASATARAVDLSDIPMKRLGRSTGHLWEQTEFAWYARRGISLNLVTAGPYFHRCSVLALHDAAIFVHPENFSWRYRTLHRFLRPRLARRARRLLTISEFSRRELARYCAVPESAFEIVGDSAEHIAQVTADAAIIARHGLRTGRFVLAVGNQTPNKNIAAAVRAFQAVAPADWQMVVAGGGADRIFGSTQQVSSARVIATGRVTDGELRALYEHAGLFVFPSKYEGFGVPPLEAGLLGCPVLASNAAAIPEVLGDAAEYFELGSDASLQGKLRTLLAEPVRRQALATVARDRASRFSWQAHGEALCRVLEEVAA